MPSSLFRELFHFVSVQCTELYRYPIRIDTDQVELMLGIVTRLWLTIEFPEYEGTKIDMVHAKAIYKTLNVNGLINTHTINGMECCNLSDEGIQWCISVLVNEDQNGTFDEMMIFAEEEKFRNVTFKELNLDDKFRVKK